MLTGDRPKNLGLIFTIALASFLLENQSSIFIMKGPGAKSWNWGAILSNALDSVHG
jgi:hypothetical protein